MIKSRYIAHDESETDSLGIRLAKVISQNPGLVGLEGTLGAGKTRLAKAIAAAWGYDVREIASPTFTICVEHCGSVPFLHVDAYRIDDDNAWYETGIDEAIELGEIVIVEWADRIAHLLPPTRATIRIEVSDDGSRVFELSGFDFNRT